VGRVFIHRESRLAAEEARFLWGCTEEESDYPFRYYRSQHIVEGSRDDYVGEGVMREMDRDVSSLILWEI
jgi:hypothetical protein